MFVLCRLLPRSLACWTALTTVGGLGRKKRHQPPTVNASVEIDDGLDDAPTDVTAAASAGSDSNVALSPQANSKQGGVDADVDLVPQVKVRKDLKKKKKKKNKHDPTQPQTRQRTMVRKITLPPRRRSKGRGIKVTQPMEGKVAPPVVVQVDSKTSRSPVADTKTEAKISPSHQAAKSVRPANREAKEGGRKRNTKQPGLMSAKPPLQTQTKEEQQESQPAATQAVVQPKSDGQDAAMTTAHANSGSVDAPASNAIKPADGDVSTGAGGSGGGVGVDNESSSEDDFEWALRSPVERAREAAQNAAQALDGAFLSSGGNANGGDTGSVIGSGAGHKAENSKAPRKPPDAKAARAAKERQLNPAEIAERQLNAEFLNMGKTPVPDSKERDADGDEAQQTSVVKKVSIAIVSVQR